MAYLGGIRSREATLAYLQRNIAHWDAHGFGIWILRDPTSSEVMGRGGLRYVEIDGSDEPEIGYAFFPEHWGRGLATELARAVCVIAFSTLDREDVVAFSLPDNLASRRVMEKAGMKFEKRILRSGVPQVLYRLRRDDCLQGEEQL